MKTISRFLWFGGLTLLLAVAACAPTNLTPFPTPEGFQTLNPENNAPTATRFGTETTPVTGTAITETSNVTETASPSGTAVSPTSGTVNPQIPVTGLNINLLDCPFCVNERAYTMLLVPDATTFQVVSNPSSNTNVSTINCATIEVTSGRQVVMCAGPKKSIFNLHLCNNAGDCIDYPVALIDCIIPTPLSTSIPLRTRTPTLISPTLIPPTSTNTTIQPTFTDVPTTVVPAATNTTAPAATSTTAPPTVAVPDTATPTP
ncbi:MAG: hypothetical protein QM730_00355 [Anaerolineales bacterium]